MFSGTVDLSELPAGLSRLDLSSNQLRRLVLSKPLPAALMQLYLYNNPWYCPLPTLPPWVVIPPCTVPMCTDLHNPSLPLYFPGDYICFNGSSFVCSWAEFVRVGPCVGNELVNCSQFDSPCAEAWSTDLQQSLTYCGRNADPLRFHAVLPSHLRALLRQ
eukprot:RCo007773